MSTEPGGSPLRFRLTLAGLIVVLVGAPVAAMTFLDLDARTPFTIAQDTLHERYDLVFIDEQGDPLPEGSGDPTVTEFSLEPGATTTGVRFGLDGRVVSCTVHVPDDDPHDVTAACE